MDLQHFKEDCLKRSPDIVVKKHLIDGSSFFFDEIELGKEFDFKFDLAESLNVHIRDIVIVGSAKLGFSIKPDGSNLSYYPFKKFDYNFEKDKAQEKSDLDIAIISGELFDQQLINLYNHTGGYTSKKFGFPDKRSLAKYILKGWLRPDYIPKDYSITSQVVTVQNRYKAQFGRKVSIGIYKSWYFFENYHQNNIRNIKINFIATGI